LWASLLLIYDFFPIIQLVDWCNSSDAVKNLQKSKKVAKVKVFFKRLQTHVQKLEVENCRLAKRSGCPGFGNENSCMGCLQQSKNMHVTKSVIKSIKKLKLRNYW
jgi:hypothetical protein